MFKKWNEKLKKLVSGVGSFVKKGIKNWSDKSNYRANQEFRQIGFQELTPLEEARIRHGYWNPRW